MVRNKGTSDKTNGVIGDNSEQSSAANDAGSRGNSGNGSGDGSGDFGSGDGNANDRRGRRDSERFTRSDSDNGTTGSTKTGLESETFDLLDEEQEAPKIVTVAAVAKAKRNHKKKTATGAGAVLDITLTDAQIYEFIDWGFKVPKLYGLGEHWVLSKAELTDLTKKTRAVLDQFPETFIEKYAGASAKWLAPISLIFSVLTLVSAKYAETQMIKKYAEFSQEKDTTGGGNNAKQSETVNSANRTGGDERSKGANPGNGSTVLNGLFGRID